MKKVFFLLIILSLSNCNPSDCFDSTGDIIQKEVTVDFFDKIEVGEEITMIIKQGETQKIVIETGENLIDNVTVEVIDGKLFMKDESSCNLTRDYAVTKIFVTSPNIKEIRSNTARDILSDGIIKYNELTLISENENEDSLNIGDFYFEIDNLSTEVISNGSSIFNISGKTNLFRINFLSGSTRLISNDFNSYNIEIIQKSTNDILIYPRYKLIGDIYSIGDVISYHQPVILDIQEHYTGKLIFE